MAKVALIECNGYGFNAVNEALRQAIDSLGGIEKFVRKGERVLLKPNVLGPYAPEAAVTTHPAVVKAVIQLVKEAGAIPFIGEMSWLDERRSTAENFKASGLKALAEEEAIELIPFETAGFKKVKVKGKRLSEAFVALPVLEADRIISLPKLKTHLDAIMTCAIKNSFAFIPMKTRKQGHSLKRLEFHEFLVDVFSIRKPDLVLADAIEAMDGNGPTRGGKVKMGLIAASDDGVALDSAMASISGLKEGLSMEAAGRGLGEADLSRIVFSALKPEQFMHSFRPPSTIVSNSVPAFLRQFFVAMLSPQLFVDETKCTNCMECVNYCPSKAFEVKRFPKLIESKCIQCYGCRELCKPKAIKSRTRKFGKIIHWVREKFEV
ncbi:MAG: DUF362 domain-containing protein [Candidatus Diapherotrites archaeon]